MNRMGRPALSFISEDEFLALPETVDKVELIDGEVIVAPGPSYFHQEVVARLAARLRAWATAQPEKITVGQAPLDVRFAPGRILQPDLFVVFDRIPFDHEGPIARVPELCVEVLSARPNYDRFTKRLIYAEAGVEELWTIEPGYFAERWTGEGLREVTKVDVKDATMFGSALLSGFVIDLAALFSEDGG
jgi:Uma2 family endonuclease